MLVRIALGLEIDPTAGDPVSSTVARSYPGLTVGSSRRRDFSSVVFLRGDLGVFPRVQLPELTVDLPGCLLPRESSSGFRFDWERRRTWDLTELGSRVLQQTTKLCDERCVKPLDLELPTVRPDADPFNIFHQEASTRGQAAAGVDEGENSVEQALAHVQSARPFSDGEVDGRCELLGGTGPCCEKQTRMAPDPGVHGLVCDDVVLG